MTADQLFNCACNDLSGLGAYHLLGFLSSVYGRMEKKMTQDDIDYLESIYHDFRRQFEKEVNEYKLKIMEENNG